MWLGRPSAVTFIENIVIVGRDFSNAMSIIQVEKESVRETSYVESTCKIHSH